MARLAGVVIAGNPRHVTQHGNGGARAFLSDSDYALYRDLLGNFEITVTVHLINMFANIWDDAAWPVSPVS